MKLTKEKRDAVEEICIQALKEADTLHRKMYLLEKLSSNVRKDLKPKRVFVPDKVTSLQKDTDTECIDSVLETYEIANRSRLITNSKQVRDPIEMLSRGYMGSDVANFINTFKANIDGLKSFSLSQR